MNVNMTKHRKKTYTQRKPNASLVIYLGGSNIEVDGGAIEWGVRKG